MNLAVQLLAQGAAKAVAICDGPAEVTYGELRERVDRLTRILLAERFTPGTRVAIWAENGVFFVVGYLAVIRARLVAVPIAADTTIEAASWIFGRAEAPLVLASDRCAPHANRACGHERHVWVEADINVRRHGAEPPPPETVAADDLAALMFTSGSTGMPKGVMVSHANIACNTRDIVEYMGLTAGDRCLVVLPFSYCYGLSLLHTHLFVGATVVINNQFRYAETVVGDLIDRACTGFAGVPSTYQMLVRGSRFLRSSFPALRWLQQAGGWLSNACIRDIADAQPGVRFYVMYGQTEATARLSYLSPDRLGDKIGSIGKGLPSTRLEVLSADGASVRPGSDDIGEIVATGGNVTLGYWQDPDETAKYFRDGRLHTGDLGRVDPDGFIYIVGRARDIVKVGGHRVSAREIEETIEGCSVGLRAAVVGAPHDVLGEALVAFVAPSFESDTRQVLDLCRGRLAAARMPEVIVHLSELPQGANGKILKAELQSLAEMVLRSSTDGVDPRITRVERLRSGGLPRREERIR